MTEVPCFAALQSGITAWVIVNKHNKMLKLISNYSSLPNGIDIKKRENMLCMESVKQF